MLNDLLSIERGLTAHGVKIVGRHPNIVSMGQGSTLRVRLSANGRIAALEPFQISRGEVWILRDGKQNSFPGIKTEGGLISIPKSALKVHDENWNICKSSTDKRKELTRLLGAFPFNTDQAISWPTRSHRRSISDRLVQLSSLCDHEYAGSVPATFKRFLLALEGSPSFLEELLRSLADGLGRSGDEWIESIRVALISPISLLIDVDDDFTSNATNHRNVGPVTNALNQASGRGSHLVGACAVSGEVIGLHEGNFPQPNLPSIGETYLFSRNTNIPALWRYRRSANRSYSIGASLLDHLHGAIAQLTEEEFKGQTWRLIPAETGDSKDLLLVSMADSGLKPADAVADEIDGEAALKELGSRVIEQVDGVDKHGYPQDQVTVLILRKVDPANRKAIYHRRTTSAEFWQAAQRWQAATSNTPGWLGFLSPVKGKAEAVVRRPPYVAPLSITPLSRIQFANGGRRRVAVIGVTAAEAFDLFLHEGDIARRARRLLRLLVRRHGALLSGLAAARVKGIENLKDFDPKTRRDAPRTTTWIGVLLHHLDHPKELYMSEAGFRLGQLFAAADVVHVGYCLDVRSGSIPSSLLGNAVLARAASHPHGALKLLLRRWPPYAAWAKNAPRILAEAAMADKGKAISLRKALSQARRVGPIAAELGKQLSLLDGRTDDVFQAELLLGYMAGLPNAAKHVDAPPDSESDETDEGPEE